MSDTYIGEIRAFGLTYAPQNWALCAGQLLPIQQNTPLFALIGTTYGGNGTTNFALPNLQGVVPVGVGQGPGLSPRVVGEEFGVTGVTVLNTQMPTHSHPITANATPGNTGVPDGSTLARSTGGQAYSTGGSLVALAPTSLGFTGGNQPHNNLQPYLVINYCIALAGSFPPFS